jgi:hypothetical protein
VHVVYGRVEEGVLEDIAHHGVVAGRVHDDVNRSAWHANCANIARSKVTACRAGKCSGGVS